MSVICIIILVKVRVRISCSAEIVSAAPVTRSSKYAVCLKSTLKAISPAKAIWTTKLTDIWAIAGTHLLQLRRTSMTIYILRILSQHGLWDRYAKYTPGNPCKYESMTNRLIESLLCLFHTACSTGTACSSSKVAGLIFYETFCYLWTSQVVGNVALATLAGGPFGGELCISLS
jgi:hypothetical protein